MRRRGPSRAFSELRTCSGKKTVNSYKAKGDANRVVFIDLEGEDVIDIDCLESLQAQSRGSSTLKKDTEFKASSFIYIDDDEDNHASPVGDLDSDATSSKSYFPASNSRQNSATSDGDECQVVQEKGSGLKGSNCKQTNSRKALGRNCYGLGFESETESDSSDSDYSDCELIEGSSGKLHEHWEKVSRKRKHAVPNGQSGSEDQGSGPGSHSDTHANTGVENRTTHGDVPVCSSFKNGNYEKENLPDFMGTRDGHVKGSSFDHQKDGSFMESNQKVAEDPLIYEWQSYHNDGMSGLWNEEEESPEEPPLWSKEELGGKQSKHTGPGFKDNVQKFSDDTTFPDSLQGSNNDQRKAGASNKEKFSCKNQGSGEMPSDHDRTELRGKDDKFHVAPSSCNTSLPKEYTKGTSLEKKDNEVSEQPFDEIQKIARAYMEENACFEDKLGAVHEKACSPKKARADFEEASLCNGTSSNQGGLDSARGKGSCDLRDQLHAQDGYVSPVQSDIATDGREIITDREKLKETAEYKLALEEEMAARQRVLQIQAEEAQRLRKRRKAESMRLLDMQRRQKQRVEEVRETQKKDEENLNLKDQLRAEIRKELNRLELTCIDMASLLRGLGIQVGAGFRPLPHEVHAAYKRALLKFHPDRASRTDIRQQVEAEEKFKLISRMKEKLVLTSCY